MKDIQNQFEEIIKRYEASDKKPKLLLHVCCAPCSSYCIEYLKDIFDMIILFYNPNIDDKDEYEMRLKEERRMISEMGLSDDIPIIEGTYEPEIYKEMIKGHELDREGGSRCSICYEMRLRRSAQIAKENNCDFFTTTLTISPLKNAKTIYDIGMKIEDEEDISYLPSDFKKKDGYKRSIELSKKYNLYRQDYCGCSYSRRR